MPNADFLGVDQRFLVGEINREKRPGGMSDWAAELQAQRKRTKHDKPLLRKNIPTALREEAAQAKIVECMKLGLSQHEAEERVVAWNSSEAAPLKIGEIKRLVYLAYKSKNEKIPE